MKKSALRKEAINRAAPIIIAVSPLFTTLVLFLIAVVFIQLSGGITGQPKTSIQMILANIGDISAALAYLVFSLIVPLGLLTGAILFAVRLAKQRTK